MEICSQGRCGHRMLASHGPDRQTPTVVVTGRGSRVFVFRDVKKTTVAMIDVAAPDPACVAVVWEPVGRQARHLLREAGS